MIIRAKVIDIQKENVHFSANVLQLPALRFPDPVTAAKMVSLRS